MESTLLTDESKTVLREAWDVAIQSNRAEVETEYATKLNEAVKTISDDSVKMVEEAVSDELESIAEQLAEAQSLELVYAEKLETFKESYAEKQEEQLKAMVNESVEAEMSELKEDVAYARKHQFGVKMYEAFQPVYEQMFGSSEMDIHQKLQEATEEVAALRRDKIMNELLENVAGDKRGVVLTILEGVSTDKLEAKFESIRPVIMKEAVESKEKPLEESTNGDVAAVGKVVLESQEEALEESSKSTIDPTADRIARSLQVARGNKY
jgi:rRNA-processing protein FCF1